MKPLETMTPASKPSPGLPNLVLSASIKSLIIKCGDKKLRSAEILQILAASRSFPSCGGSHMSLDYQCKLIFRDGSSKGCSKGCKHNGYPVHKDACKHSDQAPSVTVSKVSSDRSVPLVETLKIYSEVIGIQYDPGCQLSLVTKFSKLKKAKNNI